MNPSTPVAVLIALFFAAPLSAETLVEYTFGTTSSTLAATTSGANVLTQSFARGSGTGVSASYSTTAGAPSPRSIFVTSSLVDDPVSATSNDWLGFTISAAEGNELNLAGLGFYYAYTNTGGTISGTATFEVRSSLDNYAATISSFTQDVVNSTTPTWQQASIGLGATTYQNLDTIGFRIFLSDEENASSNSQLRIDTVTLTGVSVASVPEPASAATLLGLAGLGFAAVRRRGVGAA